MFKSKSGLEIENYEGITKEDIRNKVWDYLTEKEIGKFPLPVHHRIPNFKGCELCGQSLAKLDEFTATQTVKVNPDKPQEEVRFLTLQARKKLLVPSPRLKTGLFNLLENENDNAETLRKKSQSEGVKNLSSPIDLKDKISVDLIVIGSVAVSCTGRRIGKGEGFADLEYAMMKTMNAVTDDVPIITTVHDCQVFDELPEELFKVHDVPIDIIVTPTQIINVAEKLPRPKGIYWNLLHSRKVLDIPVLKRLYFIDQRNKVDVTLLDGSLPPDEDESHETRESAGLERSGDEEKPYSYRKERGRGGNRGRGYYEYRGRLEFTRGGRGRARSSYKNMGRSYTDDWQEGNGEGFRGGYRGRWWNYGDEYGRDFRGWPYRGRGTMNFTEDYSDNSRRGFRGRGRGVTNDYSDEPGRRISRKPRGRGRGYYEEWSNDFDRRGRGSSRSLGRQEQSFSERNENFDMKNIQVTINVSKQNKIVRRQVEETDQCDREATTDPAEENALEGSQRAAKYKNTFSIYIGGIPYSCRFNDLKTELVSRNVKPSNIAWKGSGFAFLNFNNYKEDSEVVLESLKDLSIKDKLLKVNLSSNKYREREKRKNFDTNSEAVKLGNKETQKPGDFESPANDPDMTLDENLPVQKAKGLSHQKTNFKNNVDILDQPEDQEDNVDILAPPEDQENSFEENVDILDQPEDQEDSFEENVDILDQPEDQEDSFEENVDVLDQPEDQEDSFEENVDILDQPEDQEDSFEENVDILDQPEDQEDNVDILDPPEDQENNVDILAPPDDKENNFEDNVDILAQPEDQENVDTLDQTEDQETNFEDNVDILDQPKNQDTNFEENVEILNHVQHQETNSEATVDG